jgi:hypothetical protein
MVHRRRLRPANPDPIACLTGRRCGSWDMGFLACCNGCYSAGSSKHERRESDEELLGNVTPTTSDWQANLADANNTSR